MAAVYEKTIKYVEEHIKDEIKLDNIANIVGYSLPHIYKIFKTYSSYPIKKYIRRRKLYTAANELYTGRKIFDIALDYGYETPAGFFRAFHGVFDCSPSVYKNNILKEGINMIIENIKTITELNEALEIC